MITEVEFELDGHAYRAGRLSTFDQLRIAGMWRDALLGLAFAKKERPKEVTDAGFREAINLIMVGGLGKLTRQSQDEITHLALSTVTRQQAGNVGWAPVVAPGGAMMFQDIGLPQLVVIMYRVFDHNGILDFFSGGLSISEGEPPKKEAGSPSPMARVG
jgi:hypothetical protein